MLAFIIIVGLVFPQTLTVQASSLGSLKLTPTAKSTKSVKVKVVWKKCSKATIYRVYRSKAFKKEPDYLSNTKKLGFKKIKTLKKKTTKYTDKKVKYGCWYVYKVVALKKSKGKYVKVDTTMMSVYTAPDTVCWDDYIYSDCYLSPSRIDLSLYYGGQGLKSKGVEIYRKESGGSYKKLASVARGKSDHITYKDTSVQAGQSYTYKARTYLKVGKKKKYGPWSDTVTLTAVTRNGTFAAEYLNPDPGQAVEQLLIKVSSDTGTGVLEFSEPVFYPENEEEYYFAVSYSKDDQASWIDVKDQTLVLNAGETVVLKLVPLKWVNGEDGADGYAEVYPFTVPSEGLSLETINPIRYNKVASYCYLSIHSDNAVTLGTAIASEYVH